MFSDILKGLPNVKRIGLSENKGGTVDGIFLPQIDEKAEVETFKCRKSLQKPSVQ